ncbi:T-cell surface glycoprotein CD3 epsilon chain [Pseudonaja textilis]|uniref:T-cell surface glycoprotein CD3 epsilon chain n=1 Tax=Pseudonaja textilis TaxID=8673 RepID=UPI000EA98B55|nr:T-cell surface glycoprotein CD3 epsilon chain [Pseudonaja textilis]
MRKRKTRVAVPAPCSPPGSLTFQYNTQPDLANDTVHIRCLGAEPPPHRLMTLSSLSAPPHRKGTDRLQRLLQLRLEIPGNRQLRTRRDWTAEGALQAHVGPVQCFQGARGERFQSRHRPERCGKKQREGECRGRARRHLAEGRKGPEPPLPGGGRCPLGAEGKEAAEQVAAPTARQAEGQVEEIKVELSLGKVFLTCPGKEFNWWDMKSDRGRTKTLNFSTPDDQLERGWNFFCGQKNAKFWKIYLQIKGCKDCVELSFGLGAGIVVADLLLTLGVLLLVYFCSQKQQALFRPGAPRRLQGQQTDQPPPVPNPDYEPIRKGQREVYAGLEPQAS